MYQGQIQKQESKLKQLELELTSKAKQELSIKQSLVDLTEEIEAKRKENLKLQQSTKNFKDAYSGIES